MRRRRGVSVAVAIAAASAAALPASLACADEPVRPFGAFVSVRAAGRVISGVPFTSAFGGAGASIAGGPIAALSRSVRARIEVWHTFEGIFPQFVSPLVTIGVSPSLQFRAGERLGIAVGPFARAWFTGYGDWSLGARVEWAVRIVRSSALRRGGGVSPSGDLVVDLRAEHTELAVSASSPQTIWSVSCEIGFAWEWWR